MTERDDPKTGSNPDDITLHSVKGPDDQSGPERVDDQSMEFGGYKLRQRIGEGAMGEVWAAQQLEPVRREVALKIIKPGMDSNEVVARFEAERQALALMNHPNVARIFDAGQTPRGRPYFAMEFVHGEPITTYCDRHQLGVRQRLELFIEVCEGVQHAHHKGVIHRDLKPGNILVTLESSRPRPKIIDFGIAKAISQRLTEHTVYTELGRLIGTPEYMSPEQAEMTGLDIDTRSDVYSLGVVLYVLLTGTLPFESKSLRDTDLFEIQRRIRDVDPPLPSARFATLAGDTAAIAGKHATDPATLIRTLRGDLDWITMKALEKDRTRRYDSPADFAADVRRHLNDDAVLAGSPSAFYRAQKFVRRHTVVVATGAALLVALVIGIAGTSVGLIRATEAQSKALQSRDKAVAERDRAKRARTETDEVVGFLTGLFEKDSSDDTPDAELTARQVLERGAKEIETGFGDQPLVRARLLDVLGGVYTNLGQLDRGKQQMAESLAILRHEHGDKHPATLAAILKLADMAHYSGDYASAETLAREALSLAIELHGERHETVLQAMSIVGDASGRLRSSNEARDIQLRALAIARTMPELDRATLETVVRRLGFAVENDSADAEPLFLESIDLNREIYGNAHPKTAFALDNLAIFYDSQGAYDKAEPYYREAMAMLFAIYGDDHPEIAQTLGNVGAFLTYRMIDTNTFVADTYAEANSMLSRSVAMDRRWRADHPYLGNNLVNLAQLRAFAGHHADVEPLAKEALVVYAKSLPDDHPLLGFARATLGRSLLAQARYTDAETALLGARTNLVGEEGYEDMLKEVLDDLTATYEALGNAAVANRYRAERAALGNSP